MNRLLLAAILSAALVGGVAGGLIALDASQGAIGFAMLAAVTLVASVGARLTSPPIPSPEELEARGYRADRERPKGLSTSQ